MPTVGHLFKELSRRHLDASNKNDLRTVETLVPEYESLLNSAPHEVPILFGLGTAKMQLGCNGTAIALFQQALTLNPNLPELWNNLGSAWKAENNNAQAEMCWKRALELREDADYYNNMVTLFVNEGKPEEGEYWASKGLEKNPEHKRLHWNYSLLMLEQGRWKEGWEHYDWGLLSFDRPARNYSNDPNKVPWWDGTPGKRVVVYGEQGMGDEIMFASALPDLMKDCDVVFDCHDRMIGLFERSFGVKCYPTRKEDNLEWPRWEKLDAKVAIGSLFGFYRSEGVFPKQPYLKPRADLVEFYRKRLRESGDGPYVGIAWSAGVKKTRNDLRSLKISHFRPLMEQGGTFVSLQYHNGSGEKVDRFNSDTGFNVIHWPDVVETGLPPERRDGFDYDHTVALIAALDLCVLPNTTAVHVCGAIGKDCWTLTPSAAAWRYQLTGADMPMYGPWVRQFRQNENIWNEVAVEYGNYRRSWSESPKVA